MGGSDQKIPWYWLPAGLALIFVAVLYYQADPESSLFPACPFRQLTGILCTGCGSQRALHDLMHLDLAGAFRHNLLFPPALMILGWHGASRFAGQMQLLRFKSPLEMHLAPKVLLVVIAVFTLLRNLPWEPFRILAP